MFMKNIMLSQKYIIIKQFISVLMGKKKLVMDKMKNMFFLKSQIKIAVIF